MKSIVQYLTAKASGLLDSATRGDGRVLAMLKIMLPFSRLLRGLWYFRQGEISQSLKALSSSLITFGQSRRFIEQAEEILEILSQPPASQRPERNRVLPFNSRVLFACHSAGAFEPNGYALRTSAIINALSKRNISISAFTRLGYPWDLPLWENQPRSRSSRFNGVVYQHRYDPLRLIYGRHSAYISSYASYLQECAVSERATVIHAHSNFLNGLAAHNACLKQGQLSVYELRGLWHLSRACLEPDYEETEHFQYCERMEVSAALLCDRVVTISRALKTWLVARGVSAGKITVVPNGAEPLRNASPPTAQRPPVIGYAGGLNAYEGIDDALTVISILKSNGVDVRLMIAGEGICKRQLQALAATLEIQDRVNFEGQISFDRMTDFYDGLSLVIIPRKDLPVTRLVPPMKLAEAMASGKPVLASRLPPIAELIEHDRTGLLLEAENPNEWADEITALLASPDRMSRLSRAAYELANHRYSWNQLAEKYIDVYADTDRIGES